jgi:hypothetical protein
MNATLDAAGQDFRQVRLRPHAGRGFLQRRTVRREVDLLTGPQHAPPVGARAVDAQAVSGENQPLGTAARGDAARHMAEQRHDQPVLGAGLVVDLDLDLAVGAGEPAHQQVRHVPADPVAAVVRAERHRVGQHEGAACGAERRLQHQGPVEVAPAAGPAAGRRHLPVPGRIT